MERSELFERALASADGRKSIDDLVDEFISLYHRAKKQVKFASAHYTNQGGPLLAGGLKIHEAEDSARREDDLYWAEEAMKKGRRVLSLLQNKQHELLDQIKDRRARGIRIAWDSETAKRNVEDLIDNADDFSEEAKEVRQLSMEIDKAKDAIKNLLKSYKLIQ